MKFRNNYKKYIINNNNMILFTLVFFVMLCYTPFITYKKITEDYFYINEWDVVDIDPPDFTHGHFL